MARGLLKLRRVLRPFSVKQHMGSSTQAFTGNMCGIRKEEQAMRVAHVSDQVARIVFLVCAILLVLIMLGVFIIIGSSAFRIFFEGATVKGFFFGTFWDPTGRSEERRVGKECRSRWSPYH